MGVKITNLKVPTTYTIEEPTHSNGLILDCEYELGTEETGFVLKWLFNDHSIYQWIPSHKPYALVSVKIPIENNNENLNRQKSIENKIWNCNNKRND